MTPQFNSCSSMAKTARGEFAKDRQPRCTRMEPTSQCLRQAPQADKNGRQQKSARGAKNGGVCCRPQSSARSCAGVSPGYSWHFRPYDRKPRGNDIMRKTRNLLPSAADFRKHPYSRLFLLPRTIRVSLSGIFFPLMRLFCGNSDPGANLSAHECGRLQFLTPNYATSTGHSTVSEARLIARASSRDVGGSLG
jgi:hypothetical protein